MNNCFCLFFCFLWLCKLHFLECNSIQGLMVKGFSSVNKVIVFISEWLNLAMRVTFWDLKVMNHCGLRKYSLLSLIFLSELFLAKGRLSQWVFGLYLWYLKLPILPVGNANQTTVCRASFLYCPMILQFYPSYLRTTTLKSWVVHGFTGQDWRLNLRDSENPLSYPS